MEKNKLDTFRKSFYGKIKNHNLIIVRDQGVDRHLVFRNNKFTDTFEIFTKKNFLTICYDENKYHFNKVEDMFNYFQGNNMNPNFFSKSCINPKSDIYDSNKMFKKEFLKALFCINQGIRKYESEQEHPEDLQYFKDSINS